MALVWSLSSLAVAASPALPPSCEALVPVEEFRSRLESAWTALREDRQTEARDSVLWLERRIACLDGPLSLSDAAALHREKALLALYAGDRRGARDAAMAAVRLQGEAASRWGEEVAGFSELVADSKPSSMKEEFGTSLAARVYVDGEATSSRYVGQPVVVQIFTPEGAPLAGAWVDSRDLLPDWVAFPPSQCAEKIPIDDLLTQAAMAESAYAALDVATFESALQAVGAGLPCLSGRIGIAQAAVIHRLEGVRQFTHGAETPALRSFQEAQALDPAYVPAEALIRPGSSLASLWELASRAAPSPWLAEPVPDRLTLVVDGLVASVRPAALPSIVQLTAASGEVLWTSYVPPGASLPDLGPYDARADALEEAILPPALLKYREEGERQRTRARRGPLFLTGIGLLTASAALYVTNSNALLEYRDPETPFTRLRSIERAANLSATGSSVLLVGGIGTIVVSALIR